MDKEKLVKDLIDTFKDDAEIHLAYKDRMRQLIADALISLGKDATEKPDLNLIEWIQNFVDNRFKRPE